MFIHCCVPFQIVCPFFLCKSLWLWRNCDENSHWSWSNSWWERTELALRLCLSCLEMRFLVLLLKYELNTKININEFIYLFVILEVAYGSSCVKSTNNTDHNSILTYFVDKNIELDSKKKKIEIFLSNYPNKKSAKQRHFFQSVATNFLLEVNTNANWNELSMTSPIFFIFSNKLIMIT